MTHFTYLQSGAIYFELRGQCQPCGLVREMTCFLMPETELPCPICGGVLEMNLV